MDNHGVNGLDHVQRAATILKDAIDDLFALPGAAQQRAITAKELTGSDSHGDDLLCGCWAAASTATALLELAGRHMDAVVHLLDAHPGFAPSAGVLSRSALEGLLRSTWLLTPDDPVEREQRWVALKREEARFYTNLGQEDAAAQQKRIDDVNRTAVAVGGNELKGIPPIESMAKQFGRSPGLYDSLYRWNSQAAHGTLVGAGTFDPELREDWISLGNDGEWIEAEFWSLPLVTCWEAAAIGLPVYRDRLVPGLALASLEREDDFLLALKSVPANFQATRSAERLRSASPDAGNRSQRRASERQAQLS